MYSEHYFNGNYVYKLKPNKRLILGHTIETLVDSAIMGYFINNDNLIQA